VLAHAGGPLRSIWVVPEGLSFADECPDSAPVASAAASALVPLKAGLTLSHTWIGKVGDYEHECLVQITDVTPSYIDVTERERMGTASAWCRQAPGWGD
jgi:hypothetical protein